MKHSLRHSCQFHPFKNASIDRAQRGQVIVEYILLLVLAITIAGIMTRVLVKRDPNQPGLIIARWFELTEFVVKDLPEK